MSKTLSKHIRIEAEHWKRLEDAARERNVSPNQLLVEARDGRPRPQPVAKYRSGNRHGALLPVHCAGSRARHDCSWTPERDR